MRTAAISVAFALGLHALVAAAIALPQVLAPVAARELGLPASGVGLLAGLIFVSMLPMGLLSSHLAARFSERRVCQVIAAFVTLGLLIGAGTGMAAPRLGVPAVLAALLVCTSVLFGFANGLVNPAGNQLLFNTVPDRVRSIAFSIKQSAVPLGGTLVGLLVPILLLSFSWQVIVAAFAVLAGAVIFAILAVPLSDVPRGARHALSLREIVSPFWVVWNTGGLRELGIVAVFYNAYQLSMLAYVVTFLNLEVGVSLRAAGTVYSAMQITAVAGRIAWGVSVDLQGAARRQIGLIGLMSAASAVLIGSFTQGWPVGAMVAVGILAGGSAVSWNGIFLAEVARLAPEGEVGKATGGMMIFFAAGGLVGPALFSAAVALLGTFNSGFFALAIPLIALGLRLCTTRRRHTDTDTDTNTNTDTGLVASPDARRQA